MTLTPAKLVTLTYTVQVSVFADTDEEAEDAVREMHENGEAAASISECTAYVEDVMVDENGDVV